MKLHSSSKSSRFKINCFWKSTLQFLSRYTILKQEKNLNEALKLNVVQQSVLWVIWHFCKRKEFNNLPKSFSITRTTIFKVGSFFAMLSIMKNAIFLWIFATKVTFFWCFFYYIFVEVWKTVSCIFILLAISTTVLKMKISYNETSFFIPSKL